MLEKLTTNMSYPRRSCDVQQVNTISHTVSMSRSASALHSTARTQEWRWRHTHVLFPEGNVLGNQKIMMMVCCCVDACGAAMFHMELNRASFLPHCESPGAWRGTVRMFSEWLGQPIRDNGVPLPRYTVFCVQTADLAAVQTTPYSHPCFIY